MTTRSNSRRTTIRSFQPSASVSASASARGLPGMKIRWAGVGENIPSKVPARTRIWFSSRAAVMRSGRPACVRTGPVVRECDGQQDRKRLINDQAGLVCRAAAQNPDLGGRGMRHHNPLDPPLPEAEEAPRTRTSVAGTPRSREPTRSRPWLDWPPTPLAGCSNARTTADVVVVELTWGQSRVPGRPPPGRCVHRRRCRPPSGCVRRARFLSSWAGRTGAPRSR